MRKRISVDSRCKKYGIIIFLYFIYRKIGCPLRFLFGICCPGCGMTRAIIAIINLKFKEAFVYHPMVFSLPLLLLIDCFLKKGIITKRIFNIIFILWLLLLISVYFARLFSGSSIVYADYEKGLFYSLFH